MSIGYKPEAKRGRPHRGSGKTMFRYKGTGGGGGVPFMSSTSYHDHWSEFAAIPDHRSDSSSLRSSEEMPNYRAPFGYGFVTIGPDRPLNRTIGPDSDIGSNEAVSCYLGSGDRRRRSWRPRVPGNRGY